MLFNTPTMIVIVSTPKKVVILKNDYWHAKPFI